MRSTARRRHQKPYSEAGFIEKKIKRRLDQKATIIKKTRRHIVVTTLGEGKILKETFG